MRITVANVISGTGALSQLGTGTTTLTGANTYTGTTTISAGTLQIGAGGTTGALGTGAVTNNATLQFNRSDALTVANAISGTGARQPGRHRHHQPDRRQHLLGHDHDLGRHPAASAPAAPTGTLGTGDVVNNAHPAAQPLRRHHGRQRHLRHRCAHQAGGRHRDADRRQHLLRHDDDLGRHPAGRRRRHHRHAGHRRRRQQRGTLQPSTAPMRHHGRPTTSPAPARSPSCCRHQRR